MSKKLKMIGVLIGVLFLLACSSEIKEDSIDSDEEVSINEENVPTERDTDIILIGALGYTAPYVSKVDDHFEGLFVDIIDEAFKRMDTLYEMKDYSFPRLMETLRVGVIDIGVDIFKKPDRLEYLDFADTYPIASFPYNLYKMKTMDFDFSGDPEELIPYRIGVIRGYSLGDYDAYLKDERFTFEYANDSEQNIDNLVNGRVDMVIDTLTTGQKIILNKELDDEIEIVEPPININYTYLAFSKENHLEELMKAYEMAIESMIEDGTIEVIYKRYNIHIPEQMKP